MNDTIQLTSPSRLYQQIRGLVAERWFRDESDVLFEALHRSFDVHRPELMERFIREDVEWRLRGEE